MKGDYHDIHISQMLHDIQDIQEQICVHISQILL